MSPDIVFDNSRIHFLLDFFDKEDDDEGFVVEKETGERVTDKQGEPIKVKDVGLVHPGSEVFVPDDADSIIDYVSSRQQ